MKEQIIDEIYKEFYIRINDPEETWKAKDILKLLAELKKGNKEQKQMTGNEAKIFILGRLDLFNDHLPEIEGYKEALQEAAKALELQEKIYKRKTELYYKEGITEEEKAEYYALVNLTED